MSDPLEFPPDTGAPDDALERHAAALHAGPPAAFGALVIGDEILSGRRQDRHMAALIAALNARGLQLAWARYVGDEPAQIEEALAWAARQPTPAFSFGGIGATPDDHTRACAARALGRPLHRHEGAQALIHTRAAEMAQEKGVSYDPDRPENRHRLHMGVLPQGARLIHNPYNRIPGFSVAHLHFVPGFPVMAHPMLEEVLDREYAAWHHRGAWLERAIIVFDTFESRLTPLMERIEAQHPGVRVFSLPSVAHPQHGPHIELGVKGEPQCTEAAYAQLLGELRTLSVRFQEMIST
ncbi:competence/damage-inducible protein A [Amphibiibacter pelophylacis]|uniref:Molybdopterin-binding protein n=1 Tax=Amphibiibacter pelophylacis TaxID=1799477 RepID=A0ACC6P638_9BURK